MQISVYVSFLLACSSVTGEAWTQFRGSDYGRTSETQVNELWDASTVAWKTPLPGRGASSPVLFGENIYLTAYTGYGTTHDNPGNVSDLERHLFCIAAADGSVVWKTTVPTTSPKNPYNTWGVGKHGFASSSVAIDKTGIYVFFGATGALAFDHAGKELWRTDCGKGVHVFGAGNSPVLYKDTVIINASVECGDLIALNKSDGSVVWRQPGIDQSWSTPVIYQSPGGAKELALSTKGKILAFNPDTGDVRVVYESSRKRAYIPESPRSDSGLLLLPLALIEEDEDGSTIAIDMLVIDVQSGEVVTSYRAGCGIGLDIADDLLFVRIPTYLALQSRADVGQVVELDNLVDRPVIVEVAAQATERNEVGQQ